MFPTKAPGPDGYPTIFYQKYWNIVGKKTINECLGILNGKGNVASQNNTNIVLIPKKPNCKEVGDYRPISVTSITKLLLNQLLIG